ncbi:MAG TPA: tautomerase family protein [Solirubrobacterales bacterium]|jgi:4-oxalocrotonate tautomerase
MAPLVQVTMVEGRDEATRAELIRELTAAAAARVLGSPRERVRVLLYEVPAADWGVGGETKGSGG